MLPKKKTTYIGIQKMSAIGRKIYLDWGDKVIAVEIYNETPADFAQRTGVKFDKPEMKNGSRQFRPFVSEIVDFGLGEIIERKKGFSKASVQVHRNLGEIIATHGVFVSEQDIVELSESSKIVIQPQTGDEAGIDADKQKYQESFRKDAGEFLGYIEVPNEKEHSILHNYSQFCAMSAAGKEGKMYVSVYLFDGRANPLDKDDCGFFFDSGDGGDDMSTDAINALNEDMPWIVMFYGTDNMSYGQRFKDIEDARKFAGLGFKAGFEKLRYYNS